MPVVSSPLPLDLPGQILRRAVGVVALGIVALLGLGLLSMRDDVAEELQGAKAVAALMERLSTLSLQDDIQAERALSQWAAEGPMRHLSVRVLDASGRLLMQRGPATHVASVESTDSGSPLWTGLQERLFQADDPFTVAWPLARPQGGGLVGGVERRPSE